MAALICRRCDIDWPAEYKLFTRCPKCNELTLHRWNATPIEPDELASELNHVEFERWLDKNNRRTATEELDAIPVLDEDPHPQLNAADS